MAQSIHKSILLMLFSHIISYCSGSKILILGDLDHRREFFYKVAEMISEDARSNHVVFFASTELNPVYKDVVSKRLIKYGIGKHEIKYDPSKTEQQNYFYQDKQTLKAFWSDEVMVGNLWKMDFDIGIGGMNMADAILFRHLEIPYIKLSQEDIEGYSMQTKMAMPVLASLFHSSLTEPKQFPVHALIYKSELPYRLANSQNYFLNMWNVYKHKNEMKSLLSKHKNRHFDDWDQEHALFLGQGTHIDILQSMMVKPPNVQNVYPMVQERKRSQYKLDKDKFSTAEVVVIFNLESIHEHDMFHNDPVKLSKFIDQNKPGNPALNKARGTETSFVLIVQEEHMLKYIPERDNMQVIVNKDSNYVTIKKLFPEQRLVWSGACTQENIISSFAIHSAPMIGFYDDSFPGTQNTQKYNCMKIWQNKVGFAMTSLDDVESFNSALYNLKDPEAREWKFTKDFAEIIQTERENKEDMLFWIDYVIQFGVGHRIPAYDQMSLVQYYNLDWMLLVVLYYTVPAIFSYIVLKSVAKRFLSTATKEKQD